MTRPMVSVCVTTYQHVAYIRQCLTSVLEQDSDCELELLVGDDGSTDGTRAIVDAIAACEPRMRVFHHPVNLGPTGNLSYLVAQARGDAIAHLDGDDFWLPGKLSAQLDILRQDADVVAVYCNALVLGADDRRLGIFNRGVPARVDMRELLRRGNFLNHSSLLYRATARDAVLGIGKSFIDYRLHLRLLRHGDLAYLDQVLVGHRWRTGGSMIKTMPTAVFAGHVDAFHEAVAAGADSGDVRAAIGEFWGKVMVQALLARRWASLVPAARQMLGEPALPLSRTWLVAASILAFPRAILSWWRRRHGKLVYFQ